MFFIENVYFAIFQLNCVAGYTYNSFDKELIGCLGWMENNDVTTFW